MAGWMDGHPAVFRPPYFQTDGDPCFSRDVGKCVITHWEGLFFSSYEFIQHLSGHTVTNEDRKYTKLVKQKLPWNGPESTYTKSCWLWKTQKYCFLVFAIDSDDVEIFLSCWVTEWLSLYFESENILDCAHDTAVDSFANSTSSNEPI